MRIVAFLQLYNELENGNLVRCLENCTKWADDIYIYDDCSDDGSQEVYLKYTDRGNIIFGSERNFKKELFHKQSLLELTLKSNPDWIGWIDGDTTLDRALTEQCEEFLEVVQKQGWNGVKLHNLNLWRHEAYHRVDNLFNDLRHVVFWRNNGKLCYEPKAELHQQQHPKGIEEEGIFVVPEELHLMHYGFSTKIQIVKKYLTYKSLGQKGWALDRLIDEQSSFELRKVNKKCYPQENVPEDYDTAQKPEPLTYDEYRRYSSWEEYKNSIESVERKDQSSKCAGKREVVEINSEVVSKSQESIGRDVKPSDNMSRGRSGKPTVTIVGMIYKSTQYLDFMMDGIRRYCLGSEEYDVDYLIIGNQPVEKVRRKLVADNIKHLIYNDPNPDDFYLNRVYRAWNYGGFNAPGEIIVFINSDDGFSPYWLETLLEHLDKDTTPCSRLIESDKMPSGQHGMKAEFGKHPNEFDERGWLSFVERHRERRIVDGGLYMPCAIYKDDFVESGGYPEGNIYEGGVGANETKFLCAGDDYYFHYHPYMSKKRHVTDFDSLVYHIIEGEKDEETNKFVEASPVGLNDFTSESGQHFGRFMDEFCRKYVIGSRVLLIGTGFTDAQYYNWPDALMNYGAAHAEYLEVCRSYYEKWKNGKYRVTLGDVRNIKSIFPAKSFDVVMWIQGPEHVQKHEMKQTFQDVADIARKAVLFSCPHGSYYDSQEEIYGNEYERHVQKSMTLDSFDGIEGFNFELIGKKDGGDGAIYIWKDTGAVACMV